MKVNHRIYGLPADRTTSRAGFTLVELLVIISIIVVLLAWLLPALERAKEAGRVVRCASNERQIGVGIGVIVAGSGYMPVIWERWFAYDAVPGLDGDGRGWTVWGILRKDGGVRAELFRCPSDDRKFRWLEKDGLGFLQHLEPQGETLSQRGQFSYAALVCGYGRTDLRVPWSAPDDPVTGLVHSGSLDPGEIPDPSKMNLVWDGKGTCFTVASGMKSWAPHFRAWREDGPPWWKPVHMRDTVFRHADSLRSFKGPNALFADGHVESKIDVDEVIWDDTNFAIPWGSRR